MKITYHGHSAFRIETGGAVILVDPFFTGNPAAKASWQEASQGLTHLLLTHGHGDHLGEAVEICRAQAIPLVGIVIAPLSVAATLPEICTSCRRIVKQLDAMARVRQLPLTPERVRAAVGPDLSGTFSVSTLADVVVCRYLGPQASEAKAQFVRAWGALRILCQGKPASPPRIWAT